MGDSVTTLELDISHQVSADGERALASVTGNDVERVVAAATSLADAPWVLALVFAGSSDALATAGQLLNLDPPSRWVVEGRVSARRPL